MSDLKFNLSVGVSPYMEIKTTPRNRINSAILPRTRREGCWTLMLIYSSGGLWGKKRWLLFRKTIFHVQTSKRWELIAYWKAAIVRQHLMDRLEVGHTWQMRREMERWQSLSNPSGKRTTKRQQEQERLCKLGEKPWAGGNLDTSKMLTKTHNTP